MDTHRGLIALPAPTRKTRMQPGTRVRLADRFIHGSTNPERQTQYRGVVMEPTPHVLKLGDSFTLVWWDGNVEPYPVLSVNLTEE